MDRASPPLLSALIALVVVCALSWPLARLGDWRLLTAFGDSHVWVFDQLADRVLAGELLFAGADRTCAAGYPEVRDMRAIAWAPALAFVPLREVLGPLGAANALQLLSLPASALFAWSLLRRWTEADPWALAPLAAGWALCPTLLATFSTGEISNTQAWILPAALLALDRAFADLRWLPAVAAVGLASAFTSPYYALALPPLGVAWGLWRTGAGRRGWRGLARAAVVGLALAAGLAPAGAYYDPGEATVDRADASIFSPARRGGAARGAVPEPSPVAQLDALVTPTPTPPDRPPREVVHQVYLGRGLLGLALLGALAGRGRGLGAGALVGGVGLALAMGPWLAVGGRYLAIGGAEIPLPALLLERAGYPTGIGGMYFRYAILAGLGGAIWAARALARLPAAAPIAWFLLAAQLGEGLQASGSIWPLAGEPVRGRAQLQAMVGDDGAVLDLPIQSADDGWMGQEALLRAVIHGRPTTGLPRAVEGRPTAWRQLRDAVSEGSGARAALRAAGYRYAVLPARYADRVRPSLRLLRSTLGPPDQLGALLVWDLGPGAPARCRDEASPDGTGP